MSQERILICLPGTRPLNLFPDWNEIVESGAKQYGYTKVDFSIEWKDDRDYVEMLNQVRTLMKKYDDQGVRYGLEARSLTCNLPLHIAVQDNPKGLDEVVIWGPLTLWQYWLSLTQSQKTLWQPVAKYTNPSYAFEVGVERPSILEVATKCNMNISVDNYYNKMVPIEWLLPQTTIRTRVIVGSEDEGGGADFLIYLKALCRFNPHVSFRQVRGLKHQVTGLDENDKARFIESFFTH